MIKEKIFFKTCMACNEEFDTSRKSKIFCNSNCKNDYHNSKRMDDYYLRNENAPIVNEINLQQLKNRNILAENLDKKLKRTALEPLGFDFKTITGYIHDDDGTKVTFFCYDMAYFPIGKEYIQIELSKKSKKI